MLVKGALFLGVGVVQAGGRWRGPVLLVMAVLSLALAGLPLSSGAIAKYVAKDVIGGGVTGLLATLAAAGSTLLMLRFLRTLKAGSAAETAGPPAGLAVPWLIVSAASVVVPWFVAAPFAGLPTLAALSPAALWASTWPILLGIVLAAVHVRLGDRLPAFRESYVTVLVDGAVRSADRWSGRLERADAVLRRWSVGSAALLAVGLALVVTFSVAG
jgi:hypothetical protein